MVSVLVCTGTFRASLKVGPRPFGASPEFHALCRATALLRPVYGVWQWGLSFTANAPGVTQDIQYLITSDTPYSGAGPNPEIIKSLNQR